MSKLLSQLSTAPPTRVVITVVVVVVVVLFVSTVPDLAVHAYDLDRQNGRCLWRPPPGSDPQSVVIALVPPLTEAEAEAEAERAWLIVAMGGVDDLLTLYAVEVTSVLTTALDDDQDDGKRTAGTDALSVTGLLPSFELFTAKSLLEAHRADPHSVAYDAIGGFGAGQAEPNRMVINGMAVEQGLAGGLTQSVRPNEQSAIVLVSLHARRVAVPIVLDCKQRRMLST
jgi:hypothetical protein